MVFNENWPIEGNIRCRAFSGEGARINRVRFESSNSEIEVWDSVAGHFTTCHAISPASVKRIRAKLWRAVRLTGV